MKYTKHYPRNLSRELSGWLQLACTKPKYWLRFSIVRRSSMGLVLTLLMAFIGSQGTTSPYLPDREGQEADKTLSPYFFVENGDESTDRLPLKHTEADVNIAGVIADVKIQQVYVNNGQEPLEAIYVFPASTRAAVYHMQMKIGERTLKAKVKERAKAREDYEQAKEQGKSASLLEQQRPNVFQMNVANIMPGDTINVELFYTESLVPEEGTYEFVYPTVVGPRYSETPAATASATERWVSNPYLTEGEDPPYTFDLEASIDAGLPIQKVASTSHDIDVDFDDKTNCDIQLKDSEAKGGNRDFILRYQLAGKKVESGLLLYEGKEENFFMAMMQPPERVTTDQIPSREYVFIVDVSGSMYGYPLDISKKLIHDLLSHLRPKDKFNIVFFAGGSKVLANQPLPVTKANIKKATTMLRNQRGGGGTRIVPALKRAINLPKAEGTSRSIVIATDGYISVEKEVFDLIRNNLSTANVFSFGIGTGVNRYLIEGMARAGMGKEFVITKQSEASAEAATFRKYIQNPVLTDIEFEFEGFSAYDVEPATVPDVFAERPVMVYGKWKGTPRGTVKLKGQTVEGPYLASLDVNKSKVNPENGALRYLWARKRIQLLDDYNQVSHSEAQVDEVTQLGLKYNLLTAYTSFVAIDDRVRNENGDATTVKQPLPLPKGVSNRAVGGASANYGYTRSTGARKLKRAQPSYDKAESSSVTDMEALEETEEQERTYTEKTVQNQPEFPGGYVQMAAFIAKHMKYPAKAKKQGIEGTVVVTFLVDTKGNLTDIKVKKSVSPALDKEALRLVKKMPKWVPGQHHGKAVPVQYELPIKFER